MLWLQYFIQQTKHVAGDDSCWNLVYDDGETREESFRCMPQCGATYHAEPEVDRLSQQEVIFGRKPACFARVCIRRKINDCLCGMEECYTDEN